MGGGGGGVISFQSVFFHGSCRANAVNLGFAPLGFLLSNIFSKAVPNEY
jgi:hypothetical protein